MEKLTYPEMKNKKNIIYVGQSHDFKNLKARFSNHKKNFKKNYGNIKMYYYYSKNSHNKENYFLNNYKPVENEQYESNQVGGSGMGYVYLIQSQ